jgi:hypothetical protein
MAFSILMLRSPSSGLIRTFVNNSEAVSGELKTVLIKEDALKVQAGMCVDNSGLTGGKPIEVRVNANATSPSGIEIFGDSTPGYQC